MEKYECEVVGVFVIRHPAADQQVRASSRLRIEVRLHVRRRDPDFDAELLPDGEQCRRERLVAILEDGVNGSRQGHGRLQAGLLEEGERFISRHELAAPARVVPEDAWRKDPGGGDGEPPERGPHEVLASRHAGEGAPEGGVPAEVALRVEEREVCAFLRCFDETRAEARLPENRVEVLRGEIARELDLSGAEPRADR